MFERGLTTANVKDYKHLRVERPAQKDVVITWRRSNCKPRLVQVARFEVNVLETSFINFSVTTDANVDAKSNDIQLKLTNTHVLCFAKSFKICM